MSTMDLMFKGLKCPNCGGDLVNQSTEVSHDVRMVRRCNERFNQDKLCKFWMIIVIPNKDYDYTVESKRKTLKPLHYTSS